MINAIPVIGWAVSLFFSISLAIPFWLIWTVFGIGEKYFYFLPPVYYDPGFWACVGIFMVVSILKLVFVPRLASISNSADAKK